MPHKIIIAEIGENHKGNMDIAKTLIEKAAEAGADYVKFQSYKPENFRKEDPEYEWFKQVSLSDEDHFLLKKYAYKNGIKFLSSPFSVERSKFLFEKMGLKEIKIASGVMLNFPILDLINAQARTVFLSTGMAKIHEIENALAHLQKIPNLYILHCVTQYPCKDEEANLKSVLSLKKIFPQHKIGYSDHTIGIEGCLAAAALGAEVIEKHFTLDKNATEGTDHIISVEPDELKDMVRSIRKIELQLGEEKKEPTLSEQEIKDFVRKRFV